ncbi:MAG: hypothetical protein ACMUIE_02425 [Thermoplasmatota archaeon]
MRLLVGNQEFSSRIRENLGDGKLVLFKYGPGSGGDMLLKQFFADAPQGVYSLLISTHESDFELMGAINEMNLENPPELLSMLPLLEDRLKRIEKKDHFISEGIMVTDLLEISSSTEEPRARAKPHLGMLAVLTTAATKQVLPFWLVLDSLNDLIELTGPEELLDRLMVLKRYLKIKGGIAMIACPVDWDELRYHETTFFDAVIEVRAEKKGEAWTRKLVIKNNKGSGNPPEEWPITMVKDIPTALSMD